MENISAWKAIAHECTQKIKKRSKRSKILPQKYPFEEENVDILPKELKQNRTQSNLLKDRKFTLENAIKSHMYNIRNFDINRRK